MRHDDVAAGIVWNGGEVLVARRYDADHQGGLWEFPGGKRRSGETVEGCLARELGEEVGLTVRVGSLWRALTHLYADRRVSLYFHHCDVVTGSARAIECAEIRWIVPSELVALEFVEGDVAVLHDLARDLEARRGPRGIRRP